MHLLLYHALFYKVLLLLWVVEAGGDGVEVVGLPVVDRGLDLLDLLVGLDLRVVQFEVPVRDDIVVSQPGGSLRLLLHFLRKNSLTVAGVPSPRRRGASRGRRSSGRAG